MCLGYKRFIRLISNLVKYIIGHHHTLCGDFNGRRPYGFNFFSFLQEYKNGSVLSDLHAS